MKQSFYPNQSVYTSKKTLYINFSGSTVLKAGVSNAFDLSSYLSFDLRLIDKNSNIVSAKLKLYPLEKSVLGNVILNLAILNQKFIDTSITAEDIISKTFLKTIDVTDINDFVEIDLKEEVEGYLKGFADYSFGLAIYSSTTAEGFVSFANTGYDVLKYYPVLEVEFNAVVENNRVSSLNDNFEVITSNSKVDETNIATTFATINKKSDFFSTGLGVIRLQYEDAKGELVYFPEKALTILPLNKSVATTLAARNFQDFLIFSQVATKIYGFINCTSSTDNITTVAVAQSFPMTEIFTVDSNFHDFTERYLNQVKFDYVDLGTSTTNDTKVTIDSDGIVTVPSITTGTVLAKSRNIKVVPSGISNRDNYLICNLYVDNKDNVEADLTTAGTAVMANITRLNAISVNSTELNGISTKSTFCNFISGISSSDIFQDLLLISDTNLTGLTASIYRTINSTTEEILCVNKELSGNRNFISDLIEPTGIKALKDLDDDVVNYRIVFTSTRPKAQYKFRIINLSRVKTSGTIQDKTKVLYQSPIVTVTV